MLAMTKFRDPEAFAMKPSDKCSLLQDPAFRDNVTARPGSHEIPIELPPLK